MKVSRAAAVDAQKREEASRFVMPTAACPNAVRASFHRVFTSKLAHGVANKIKRDAKRERHRASLAAFGALYGIFPSGRRSEHTQQGSLWGCTD